MVQCCITSLKLVITVKQSIKQSSLCSTALHSQISKFRSHVHCFTGHRCSLQARLFLLILKYPLSVTDSPKGAGGESSSLDEDSSDALSPDQPTTHDSPLSAVPQLSPSDVHSQNGDMSPTQVLTQDVIYV